MLVVERLLGNINDSAELARLGREWGGEGGVERLRLSIWDAQKSRLRATTDHSREVGINLERGSLLRDGDVLYLSPGERRMVVVELQGRQVLTVRVQP